MSLLCESLTSKILDAFFTVYNTLGYGFLEKVYQNAMYIELKKRGLDCKTQEKIDVYYSNRRVGEYFADMLVEDLVILELKAAETLCEAYEYQLQNYLKATDVEIGFLLNFGKRPQYKRKIFENKYK